MPDQPDTHKVQRNTTRQYTRGGWEIDGPRDKQPLTPGQCLAILLVVMFVFPVIVFMFLGAAS